LLCDTVDRVIALSEKARNSLTVEQMRKLSANASIVSAPIDNIDSSAGGSVRWMLSEVHLPAGIA
jgi:hypothetical protein